MNTTIYHIDKNERLKIGSILDTNRTQLFGFGDKCIFAMKKKGVTLPQPGKERAPDELLSTLHPIVLREYLLETMRLERKIPVSRLKCMFACESIESAQALGKRMELSSGLPIYRAQTDGLISPHDMTWLDHDFGGPPYSQRSTHYAHDVEGKRTDEGQNQGPASRPSLMELIVQGRIEIVELAGRTVPPPSE